MLETRELANSVPPLTHSIICALSIPWARYHQDYLEDKKKPASLGEWPPCSPRWHKAAEPKLLLALKTNAAKQSAIPCRVSLEVTASARLAAGKTTSVLLKPHENISQWQRGIVTDVAQAQTKTSCLWSCLTGFFLDPVSPRKLLKGLAGGAGLLGGSCDHRRGSLPPRPGDCHRQQEATSY